MTWSDHAMRWLAGLAVAVAAGSLMMLERLLLEIVLAAVSPENDMFHSRAFLAGFPSLIHMAIAALLPLLIVLLCSWRRVSTERFLVWLFAYFVALVAIGSVVGIMAVRLYRGLSALG